MPGSLAIGAAGYREKHRGPVLNGQTRKHESTNRSLLRYHVQA